ncbi:MULTISPECIES: GNAT family N-acetyltransferase [unclassified Janthinobacterium]|uniref:GNAT family N-acetyltransferase n=1 Tax=unclassified Janthinobacterium TaxID=2610881 RepID=UPI000C70F003|nr:MULTISPECIES: GNAT family N-acetyltransferase [unclassified Janthinobacterium]PKV44202.1 putative GNAT family N-acyltransferase [Janthinobacterium sp. 61]TDY35614.1 putative GNAT family N-acyltransferase [Janthinobacterium sp. 75]
MTKHTIRLGDWATLGLDATAIRFEVFVDEQKVPAEIELDDMDAVCLHAVAYDGSGNAIGTGRLLPDGHIGRMAVRQPGRGTGVGGAILSLLMQKARERGDAAVVLNAQTVAAPFYARHGFVQQGEVFEEAGIAHVEMRLEFK